RPGQLREVPCDRRVGRHGVDREPHAERAIAVVEGLLETQDLAVNPQTVDRRPKLLVQVLVDLGEEVERVEDAVLGGGDWFSEIFSPRTEATNDDALAGDGSRGGCGGSANA